MGQLSKSIQTGIPLCSMRKIWREGLCEHSQIKVHPWTQNQDVLLNQKVTESQKCLVCTEYVTMPFRYVTLPCRQS